MSLNYKKIPPYDLALIRGSVRTRVGIKGLHGSTLSYSFVAPGTRFPDRKTLSSGEVVDVVYEAIDPDDGDFFTAKQLEKATNQAILQIRDVIQHDSAGTVSFQVANQGWEPHSRLIDTNLQPKQPYQGDIKIMVAPLQPAHALGYAHDQYRGVLGVSTDRGMTIIINSKAQVVADDDPRILQVINGKNVHSLLELMYHEFTHIFGGGHVKEDTSHGPRQSSMWSALRPGRPYSADFCKGYWREYYGRVCFSRVYGYSLDHVTAGPLDF